MKTNQIVTSIIFTLSLISLNSFAQKKIQTAQCQAVIDKCTSSGFVLGKWKEGFGLWADCINPLIQGKPQPKKATKPLPNDPSVAGLVSACKASDANFGEPKPKSK